jgi:hypothetical protein
MPSSGMLRHVALVKTNVLEKCITSIIRVTDGLLEDKEKEELTRKSEGKIV